MDIGHFKENCSVIDESWYKQILKLGYNYNTGNPLLKMNNNSTVLFIVNARTIY